MFSPGSCPGSFLWDVCELCLGEEGSMSYVHRFGFGSGPIIIIDGGIKVPHGHDGVQWVLLSQVDNILVYLASDLVCSRGSGGAIYAYNFHVW